MPSKKQKKPRDPASPDDFTGPFSVRLDYDVIPYAVKLQGEKRSGKLVKWINSKLREEMKSGKSMVQTCGISPAKREGVYRLKF
jgi:hypothetical protein